MRRRTNQRSEGAFHPLAFDATDSHERVLHRGPPHVEPVRRKRTGLRVLVIVLVEAAPERTGMRRRRTHARFLLSRNVAVMLVLPRDDVAPVRGDGPVEGEPDRMRGRRRGAE